MKRPTTVVLLRHGQTDWNLAGKFQGRADIPLNDTGLAQAERAAPALAELGPDTIVSSPLTRARQTAEAVYRRTGRPISFDDRLMEIDVGSWVGLTLAEADAESPEVAALRRASRDYRRSPTGETSMEAGTRVAAAVRDIAAAHPGEVVLVVSHGLVIRIAAGVLAGLDYPGAVRLGPMRNGAWTVLRPGARRWRIVSYNQSAEPDNPSLPGDDR
jgi:probable phosphoglycerate mutase